jgi:hypothetical protein
MCYAGTNVSDDGIGTAKISALPLSPGAQMPGASPLEALVVEAADCTGVKIHNLTEDKLNNHPGWTVDDLAKFISFETKIIKGEL